MSPAKVTPQLHEQKHRKSDITRRSNNAVCAACNHQPPPIRPPGKHAKNRVLRWRVKAPARSWSVSANTRVYTCTYGCRRGRGSVLEMGSNVARTSGEQTRNTHTTYDTTHSDTRVTCAHTTIGGEQTERCHATDDSTTSLSSNIHYTYKHTLGLVIYIVVLYVTHTLARGDCVLADGGRVLCVCVVLCKIVVVFCLCMCICICSGRDIFDLLNKSISTLTMLMEHKR